MTDPDLQISGGLGQSQKIFFGNIGPHGLKIRVPPTTSFPGLFPLNSGKSPGNEVAPPRPLPWIRHCFFNDKRIVSGPISILDLIGAVFKQGLFLQGSSWGDSLG